MSIERRTLFMLESRGEFGWTVQFRHTLAFAGRCVYGDKIIAYSIPFMLYAETKQRNSTISHEVAHALSGSTHGHDEVWKKNCLELGGTGNSITEYPQSLYTHKNFPWIGTCPTCGRHTGTTQAPQYAWGCHVCKNETPLNRVYSWSHGGVPRSHSEISEAYSEDFFQKLPVKIAA